MAKIEKLNEIFEELISNARELTADLTESIRMHFLYGVLAILFGVNNVYWAIKYDFNFIPILLYVIMIFAGLIFIVKYFMLKSKYTRLFTILKELNNS